MLCRDGAFLGKWEEHPWCCPRGVTSPLPSPGASPGLFLQTGFSSCVIKSLIFFLVCFQREVTSFCGCKKCPLIQKLRYPAMGAKATAHMDPCCSLSTPVGQSTLGLVLHLYLWMPGLKKLGTGLAFWYLYNWRCFKCNNHLLFCK